MKQIQSIFPSDSAYFIVKQLIQNSCLLYFSFIVSSKILTDDEQIKLYEMVNNHANKQYNVEWKLLFRAGEHGVKRNDFYSKCDLADKAICIIQTPQDNVFGGYTSMKWELKWDKYLSGWSWNRCDEDEFAFVFTIRKDGKVCPKSYPVQQNDRGAI